MRDIPGYEGLYAATKDGKIWKYEKVVSAVRKGKPYKFTIKARWLKQHFQPGAVETAIRWRVSLYNAKGELKNMYVHRAVAMAFLPNPDNKPEVNHIDGDMLNNVLDNLEWCTRSENMQHAHTPAMKLKRKLKKVNIGSELAFAT